MTIQASELQENTINIKPEPIRETADSRVFYACLLRAFSRESRLYFNV